MDDFKSQRYEDPPASRRAFGTKRGRSRPAGHPSRMAAPADGRAGRAIGQCRDPHFRRTRRDLRRAPMKDGEAVFIDGGAWVALTLTRAPFLVRAIKA